MKKILTLVLILVLLNTSLVLAQIQITDTVGGLVTIQPVGDLGSSEMEDFLKVLPVNSTVKIGSNGEIEIEPVVAPRAETPVQSQLPPSEQSIMTSNTLVRESMSERYTISIKGGEVLTADDIRSRDFQVGVVPDSEVISKPLYPGQQAELTENEEGSPVFKAALSSGKAVSMESSSEEVMLESGGVTAKTMNNLKIENSALFIEAGSEYLEISVLPDAAYESVGDIVDSVGSMELKSGESQLFYRIGGTRKGALLGFIPINLEIEVSIDASSGEIYNVQRPWWSVLVL